MNPRDKPLFRWDSYPLVRPVLALISGILIGEYSEIGLAFSMGLCATFFVAYFGLHFFVKATSKTRLAWLNLIALMGVFVAVGMSLVANIEPKERPLHLKNNKKTVLAYQGKIISEVQERDKSYKFEFEIERIRTEKTWQVAEGKILVYLKKNEFLSDTSFINLAQKTYHFGDELMIKSSPILTNPPENPSSFDYQKYLKYHYIWHQDFINSYDVVLVNDNETENNLSFLQQFRKKAIQFRVYSDSVLRENIPSKQSYGVASALFLGIRDGIDEEVNNAYRSAGATHVLAVSGLHVGILSLIIAFLFKFLKNNKNTKYIYLCLILGVLFSYAFLTGLSASVLRASVMFGIVQIGQTFSKHSNIYNNLSFSAIILLVFSPYLLFEVGFQLSYLAVLGIVLIQPKIAKIWKAPNKFINYFWQLFTVSIAAQLITFPICLYYFHQFPTYFWLSGFVVIPAAMVILIGAIAIIVCSFFSFYTNLISCFFGELLSFFIKITNEAIFLIEKLPFSVVSSIRISFAESMLLYAFMIGLFCFFVLPKRIFFYFSVICSLLFGGINYYKNNEAETQKRLVFYQIRKGFALSLQEGRRSSTLLDSSSFYNKNAQNYWLTGDLLSNGKTENSIINLDSVYTQNEINSRNKIVQIRDWQGGKIIIWNNKTILLWNKKLDKETKFVPKLDNIEIVWISNNPIYTLAELKSIKTNYLVFDDTNYSSRIKLLSNEAKVNKIPTIILKNGAFQKEYE